MVSISSLSRAELSPIDDAADALADRPRPLLSGFLMIDFTFITFAALDAGLDDVDVLDDADDIALRDVDDAGELALDVTGDLGT